MRYTKLDNGEKKILEEFESGKFNRVGGVQKEAERYKQQASYTLSKSRNINIRLSERDLRRMKVIAAEKGLPYQTFIGSLLHQYSSKTSVDAEKNRVQLADSKVKQ